MIRTFYLLLGHIQLWNDIIHKYIGSIVDVLGILKEIIVGRSDFKWYQAEILFRHPIPESRKSRRIGLPDRLFLTWPINGFGPDLFSRVRSLFS